MANEKPESWPLPPSIASYTLHGICIALADVIHDEIRNDTSQRTLLKAAGLVTAAELFSNELAHFFGSQAGEDHDLLEALEKRYLQESERSR